MAKTKPTAEEIMQKLGELYEKDASGNKPTQDQIKAYINNELTEGADKKPIAKDNLSAKYIGGLMARNPKLRKELKEALPAAHQAKKDKMAALRADANRKGMDKVINDFRGKKRAQAKRELEEIAKEKRRAAGEKEIDKELVEKSISSGRGRTPLTSMVNKEALGERKDRRKNWAFSLKKEGEARKQDEKDYKKDEVVSDEVAEKRAIKQNETGSVNSIEYKTPDGLLKGARYDPAEKTSEKVVIFFSGSGAPASKYAPDVADTYLKKGMRVVAMDYRGFGKSETRTKSGKVTGTPLCEESIYKDGKQMLKYVMKEMGVKPENIILHGYSLGGSVASKVAADFAQEQQKKALEQGRTEKKLGGVVLHSPIATMQEAAAETAGSKFMGVGAWMFGGAYNTRSHMRRLCKLDPDMPVHYVSGSADCEDQLDIKKTMIHQDPQAKFKNSSFYVNEFGGHEDPNVLPEDGGLTRLTESKRSLEVEKNIEINKENQVKETDKQVDQKLVV